VILLDQRVTEQIATRRLRIVKYRGSAHGTNEYPFLIDGHGFTVLPITTIELQYPASTEIVSTGIPKLDAMFGSGGWFRGSTILVSGTAGTGKSSLAAHFAEAACRRGERCTYFGFEESPDQIARNMRSIGLDLAKWTRKGLLRFASSRPATFGLETHLSALLNAIEGFKPRIVVLDPVSSFEAAGGWLDVRSMLMRIVDLLKGRQITALLTSLTRGGEPEGSVGGVSSLIDSWVRLRQGQQGGERTRSLTIVKSRGMNHSNQERELLLTDNGIDLVEVFVGPDGRILTGSARLAQQASDRAAGETHEQEIARRKALLLRKQRAAEAKIAEMQADLAAEAEAIGIAIEEAETGASGLMARRSRLAKEREEVGGLSPRPRDGGGR
jgi:circadian clock protein KaiC